MDALVERLAELRVRAGQVSYAEIARRVGRLREDRGQTQP